MPAYFNFLTVMAFEIFLKENVDVSIEKLFYYPLFMILYLLFFLFDKGGNPRSRHWWRI